jgi:hypothetical protein
MAFGNGLASLFRTFISMRSHQTKAPSPLDQHGFTIMQDGFASGNLNRHSRIAPNLAFQGATESCS